MYETAFAKAATPAPVSILGLPLRPYSVGHELFLIGRNNAFVCDRPPGTTDLIEAALVCAHSWEEIHAPAPWLTVKTAMWRWHVRKQLANPMEWILTFYLYRHNGSTVPHHQPPGLAANETPGREPGAPFLLRLIQFLMFNLDLTEPEAMDYKLGLAQWHACAFWEAQGGLRIQNREEKQQEDFITTQEAAAAASVGTSATTAGDHEPCQA
jgi:hypothetical protein